MGNRDALRNFFYPHRVAVIGASEKGMYPAGIMQNLLENGFPGEIYPVNPNRQTVFGLPAYPRVTETPQPADLAVFTVPRQAVLPALHDCAQAGVPAAVLITAGFAESDAQGKQLQAEIASFARQSGMRLVGPNCAGLANIPQRLVAARLPAAPRPGNISLVSQSGALMMALYGLFVERQLGMCQLISLGNQVDVSLTEALGVMIEEPQCEVAAVFMEGITSGADLVTVAQRALALGKPLVMVKSGRTQVGQQAAASHTAALAGSDRVFRNVARQFGICLVDDLDELIDLTQIFSAFGGSIQSGMRIAVVTQSGGLGSLTADLLTHAGIQLSAFSPELQSQVSALPQVEMYGHVGNPADVRGAALRGQAAGQVLVPFLEDPQSDAVLLLLAKPLGRAEDLETAEAIVETARQYAKPLAVVWVGPHFIKNETNRLAGDVFQAAGIPIFEHAGRFARAIGRAEGYQRMRAAWLEDPENPYAR